MNCQDVKAHLHEWVDGELGGALEIQIRHHLGKCPQCAATERSVRNVKMLVGAKARRVPVPAGLRERVLVALSDEADREKIPRWRRGARSPILQAAAVVVCVAVAVIIGSLIQIPTRNIAHAGVAEQSLAYHVTEALSPRWDCSSFEDARRIMCEQLGVEGDLPPLAHERIRYLGVGPTTYGSVRAVRISCEIDGRPFSIFALETAPPEVRTSDRYCFCTKDDGKYLVVCRLDGNIYFSMVITGMTRADFERKVLASGGRK